VQQRVRRLHRALRVQRVGTHTLGPFAPFAPFAPPAPSKSKAPPFRTAPGVRQLSTYAAMILIISRPSVNAPTARARTVTGDKLTSFFHHGAMAVDERVSGSDAMILDAT
jgi:hypothetical protein